MTISRADLLKELLPGLNDLFGMEYKTYERRQREAIGGNEYVHMANKPTGSIETTTEFNQTRPSRID